MTSSAPSSASASEQSKSLNSRRKSCELRNRDTRVVDVYKRLSKECTPIHCIVDNDRTTPYSPFGSNAAKLMDYAGNEPYSTAGAEVLPVRETENLVPVSFCKDVYRGNDDMQMRIDTVLRVADQEQGSGVRPADYVLRYLDLKRDSHPVRSIGKRPRRPRIFL